MTDLGFHLQPITADNVVIAVVILAALMFGMWPPSNTGRH